MHRLNRPQIDNLEKKKNKKTTEKRFSDKI